MTTLTLKVGNFQAAVANLSEASLRYQQFRGMKPSSRTRDGVVTDSAGVAVARVSYNGRVWPMAPWQPGMQPLAEAA